jgi:flagellar FliL protein
MAKKSEEKKPAKSEGEAAEGTDAAKPKGFFAAKKKLILIAAGALVLLGGGGAAAFFLLSGGEDTHAEASAGDAHGAAPAKDDGHGDAHGGGHAPAAKADDGHGGGHAPAAKAGDGHGGGHGGGHGEAGGDGHAPLPGQPVFFDLPAILVNLRSDEKPIFLKLVVSLELKDAGAMRAVEGILPRVVDQFQTYLRELRVEELSGSAATYRLKEELLRRVRIAAAPMEIQDVLFKDMIVQ